MFRKGEIQAPGQSGCGELTTWIVVAIVTVMGLGVWGLVEAVSA
jgi:hypothetical protein